MEEERRNPLSDLSQAQKNEIIGRAIDAWLEKKWAQVGRWTWKGIAAAAFSVGMYYLATHGGFGK